MNANISIKGYKDKIMVCSAWFVVNGSVTIDDIQEYMEDFVDVDTYYIEYKKIKEELPPC